MLFFSDRNHPGDQTDLHWAERIDDLTFRYRGRVAGANSPGLDSVATMSQAGRFCFVSPRAYARTLITVHCGQWTAAGLTGAVQQRRASVRKQDRVAFDVEVDATGQWLVIADGRFRGGPAPETADLRQARWDGAAFRLAPADDRLFAAINTPALEYAAALSADGLTLAFTRLEGRPPLAQFSIWLARRPTHAAPFEAPVRVEAITGYAEAPTFSPAGDLYFHRRDGHRFSIWRVRAASAVVKTLRARHASLSSLDGAGGK